MRKLCFCGKGSFHFAKAMVIMMIHCIYLAAGSSRRFGGNKLLYPINGVPMFRHGLDTLLSAAEEHGDCTVTVVSRDPGILSCAAEAKAFPVNGEKSGGGLSCTLRHGIDRAEEAGMLPSDSLLFLAADQPYLTKETLLALMDAGTKGALCACVSDGEKHGNPALFSARLVPELRALTGDCGGKPVLTAHTEDCVYIPCRFPCELNDVDTRSDAQAGGNAKIMKMFSEKY